MSRITKSKENSLYNISLQAVAYNYNILNHEFETFPPYILFDIIYKLYELSCLDELSSALSNLDTLWKLLKASNKRVLLHQAFQALMNRSLKRISTQLVNEYTNRCKFTNPIKNEHTSLYTFDDLCEQGYAIGCFLSEAGWYNDAQLILSASLELLMEKESIHYLIRSLDCSVRLLNAQNGYCLFNEAENSYKLSLDIAEKIKSYNHKPDVAVLYSEISAYFILQSNYVKAYDYGVIAVRELFNCSNISSEDVVNIMCQVGKACVLKRNFKKAGLLIKQAVIYAKQIFGENHPKYADALINYGFYLLNVDAVSQGMEVYRASLRLRKQIFEGVNLHVAIAYEEMSYASYVHNYSRGTFENARQQAEKAIELMLQILPSDHLLLTSSKRGKALILEEMAIDSPNKDVEAKLLKDAHELHLDALKLSCDVFGEMNVQTAKHYGNLGRLHQSMNDFNKAEAMHLKAIYIKEKILGPDDYEVALSLGHLASLYNYDMELYREAEKLYLRSIAIGKTLFGEAYSGLEYDYRGLLKVYTAQCDLENQTKYLNIYTNWQLLRKRVRESVSSPINDLTQSFNIESTLQEFLANDT